MRRIGILEMASPDKERLGYWGIFLRQLSVRGFIERRDFVVDFYWADGLQERLAKGATDFVSSGVDIIVTAGTPAAAAAMHATDEIAIVMATGVSLSPSLSASGRIPRKNVTGISDLPAGMSERRLTLLRRAVDPAKPLAILADRANPSSPIAVHETGQAAVLLGVDVTDYWLDDPSKFEDVLSRMHENGIGGFVVSPGAMFFAKRKELARLAIERGLASIAVRREYAEAGCMMAYGAPLRENYSGAADLVARILAGAKPSDLPIAEVKTFEFLINLDTSAKLQCDLPASLLDEAECIRN